MNRPTLDNWRQPPHLVWSLRHMRELVPTAQIRCHSSMCVLDPAPADGLLDLVFAGTRQEWRLGDYLDQTETDALVVLHDGRVVLEWLAPGIRDDEPHLLFSVTKSVVALLAGALAGAGLLDLDAPVTQYITKGAGAFAGASVRHLLDMTASFDYVEDYSPGIDFAEYAIANGLHPAPLDSPGLRGFLSTRSPEGEHGVVFRYLSPTTDMLGWVCEAAAGLPLPVAIAQYIWEPLGAEADGHITLDRAGTAFAAGGMSAIPRDMARVGLLVAERGAGIVPQGFVDDLIHGGDPAPWAAGDFADWLPGGCYRSCWYQPRVDPDCAMAVGIHGQMIYVDRPRNVVVAKQSSWSDADDSDNSTDAYLAARAICRALAADAPDARITLH